MAKKRGPRSGADRVRGLLVMLPWLLDRGEVGIDEMAAQFNVDRDELIEDLSIANFCGAPPYTAEQLPNIDIYRDTVVATRKGHFGHRLALTPTEAFGLSVLADAALDLPGMENEMELKSALTKLRSLLGENLVDVQVERPPFLDEVGVACTEGEKLRITYWTPSRNETTVRVIVPRAVFSDSGHWYVTGDDELRDDERHFRIDRISAVEHTGERVPLADVTLEVPKWFDGAEGLETVSLRVASSARWVEETYPCTVIAERPDGSVDIDMVITSIHWLHRLVLRAGSGVAVLGPAHLRSAHADAAQAVLARYSDTISGN
jgi:proteasome accessory factor C